MLNIGKKKYRNLQEQVGYNTKEIERLFSILDGIDYEDHVVVIQDISVPLTAEEMLIVVEPVSFLVYENKLYFKDSEDENNLYFSAVVDIEGTDLITMNQFRIAVSILSGEMSIVDQESIVYSSAKMDEKFTNLETLISGLANGSPKGVYATLADLQSAYPTGAEGIYVVSANGHWYYWNGSAWADGGAYQAAEAIGDKVDLIKNVLDRSSSSTGVLVAGVLDTSYLSWKTSDYIPCKQGDVFKHNGNRNWNAFYAFYDANHSVVTYQDNAIIHSDEHITVPNNSSIVYARFSYNLTNMAIYNTDKLITFYVGYGIEFASLGDLFLDGESVKDKLSEIDKSVKTIKNVFDYEDENVEYGIIYVSGVASGGYTGWATTGYIPCKAGDKFSLIGATRWESWNTYYDKNKNIVSYQNDVAGNFQQIPENGAIAYVRFTLHPYTRANLANMAIYNTDKAIPKKYPFDEKIGLIYDVVTNDGAVSSLFMNQLSYWRFACGNILCIGDSLTDGLYPPNSQGQYTVGLIKENYPYYLGRFLNAEVDNYGKNGSHPTEMLTLLTNLSLDYTKYDTVIIWLGTNGGLNENDIETSGTETYAYQQIINMIKTANPNIKFVLMKVFTTGEIHTGVPYDNVQDTNAAIDLLAGNNNITDIIDNSDLAYSNYPHLHNNISNTHFGKSGNMFIAQRIVKHFSDTFNDNNVEFGLIHKDSIWN